MKQSRITIFAGHYGSGKTNLAVNYALQLKKTHTKTAIVDLDIVNPYFRTKDSLDDLNAAGIDIISSAYANTNLDVPSLPPETLRVFDDKQYYAAIDLGGDDRGATALGRYSGRLLENEVSMLLVINCYRPLTSSVDDTITIMHEVENAARFRFTGIVNNSNLGSETSPKDILKSLPYANSISKVTGLPVLYTSVKEDLAETLSSDLENLISLKIIDYILTVK